MKVQAVVSFAGLVRGVAIAVQAGQVIDLPEGVDWLTAGLVAPAPAPMSEVELAVAQRDAERAVRPRPQPRKVRQE